MANTIAEDAPVRVRYKHAGIADEQGVHRPICRPRDLKLQTVKHEKDVTCPHCLKHIEDFKGWMALQIAAGREPEDETSLEYRIMALARRDERLMTRQVADELNEPFKKVLHTLDDLVKQGKLARVMLEYVLVK